VRRVARRAAALTGAAAAALTAFVALRWDRTFDAPYPALQASRDPAAVARGRYLAYGPAHCASCHVAPADRSRFAAGGEPPMAGGSPFRLPIGTWYPANLTPDSATGIGRWTDGELARVLRHNLRRDGRPLLPAMEYRALADSDVVAVLSFLRAQPPVRHAVPARQLNAAGRAVFALLAAPPRPGAAAPPTAPTSARPADAGVARGAYVANEVAGCDGCHTQRSHLTGRYTGAPYGGGSVFPDERAPGREYVAPNLTPHPRAGHTAGWSEAQFVARMRAGRTLPGSPMHWESASRISDADLRAVYRYLRTLAPSGRAVGPAVRRRT
jgi:mono/diheme cytochrome c family protein